MTDNSGNTSDDTAWALIQETNTPPNAPTITGPTSGEAGEFYEYNFETIDVDGNNIWYYVEWGDGEFDEGFVESGGVFTLSYNWSERGDYTIKARLIDVFGAEGNWTTLDVSIPRSRYSQFNIFYHIFNRTLEKLPILRQFLKNLIKK